MKIDGRKIELLITDIDNTVFDWVTYYVKSFRGMLELVSEIIDCDFKTLANEARDIFCQHTIEYPFIVQELPSVVRFYNNDIDRMLNECVDLAQKRFKEIATPLLKPYEGVHKTLTKLKKDHPEVPLIALTDAPRYVAMWKLNKLGILDDFDAVYGLADPKLPTDEIQNKVKVSADILIKHLRQKNFDFKGKIRILPDEYEKPGIRGLKTVLMDYEIDGLPDKCQKVLWVGDNLGKDVKLGKAMGVQTAWAKYGTIIDEQVKKDLEIFAPPTSIKQNSINIEEEQKKVQPDIVLNCFSDIIDLLE